MRRPSLKAVLELGIFDRFVELSKARVQNGYAGER